MGVFDRLRAALGRGTPDLAGVVPRELHYVAEDGSVRPVRGGAVRDWHSMATRASFTQNLINSFRQDYTNVSDDLLSRAYIQSVTAAACIEVNANLAASIPPMVTDPNGEPLINDAGEMAHPLVGFTDNARRLMQFISVSQDIWGRAYLRKRPNHYGVASGLEMLRAPDVEPVLQSDAHGEDRIVGYWVGRQRAPVPVDQIIDLPVFDPADALGGLSPLEFVLVQIGVSRNLAIHTANFFFNGARLSGFLTLPNHNEAEAKLVEERFNAQYAGSRNAWRIRTTNDPDASFTPATVPPNDLAMPDTTASVNTDVCRAFGVHPALVGLSTVGDPLSAQNTFRAVMESQFQIHAIPRAEEVFDELNRQWAWKDFTPPRYYSLAPNKREIDALSPVTAENAGTVTQLQAAGTISRDEARARLDYEPLPPGALQYDPIPALSVWESGGCTLNELYIMTGRDPVGDNGRVLNMAGILYPLDRLAEVAAANADNAGAPPASPFPSFGLSGPPDEPGPDAPPVPPDEPPPTPDQGTAADRAELAGRIRELRNWERKVARSTPDVVFEPDALRDHPVAAWVRDSLEARDDPETVFWVARAWLETGEKPPMPEPPTRQAGDPGEATPAEYERYWQRFDELEADIGAAWLEWMARAGETLIPRILADPANAGAVLDGLAFDDALVDEWLGTLDAPGPLLALALGGMAAGNEALAGSADADYRSAPIRQTIDIAWDLLSEEAMSFARDYVFEFLPEINNTTRDMLRAVIEAWIESGAPMEDLERSIGAIFQDADRGKLIARTEGLRVYNEGTFARYEAAGVNTAIWQTVNVGRNRQNKLPGDVCHICSPLHGVEGDIRQGWVHPGGRGEENRYRGRSFRPPAHPQCRCFTRPVVV